MPPAHPAGVVPVRLAPAVRELLEDGYAADFRSVRVYVRRGDAGPPAFATGERVVIAEGWFRPDTSAGQLVLAHEFAHIVQKRLGALRAVPTGLHPVRDVGVSPHQPDARARRERLPLARASGWLAEAALEAEADAAATAVAAGRRFVVRLSDPSNARRYWGEAGHYYTAYVVMLAAGAPTADAEAMAQLAQMPDQVDVLDATYMGKQMLNTIPPPKSARQMDRWLSPREIQQEVEAARRREALRQQIQEVQEGVHALTGRSAADETRLRRQVLEAAPFPSVAFGVGIHSYGDSFAHRRMNGSGTMYKGPLGHAVRAIESDPTPDYSSCEKFLDPMTGEGGYYAYLGCQFGRKYFHDPHEPDHIDKRQDLYREYGLTLYDILCAKLPNDARRLSREQLQAKLEEIPKLTGEAAQIARLREIAAGMGTPLAAYAPEAEAAAGPLNWGAYLQMHPDSRTDLLQQAQGLAGQWNKLRP